MLFMLKETQKFLQQDISLVSPDDSNSLSQVLKYHSDLYYNKENPVISDTEYDHLYSLAKEMEEKFQVSIIEVGAALQESTFEKVKHSRPMISLDNTYNNEDLRDFDTRVYKNLWDFLSSNKDAGYNSTDKIEYCLEFKFDGLWVELIYDNWNFIQAITRWDGVEGEDVTRNIMQIDNIPKNIDYDGYLEVRGEVVMPISVFEGLNEDAKRTWEKIFSNPRNAASGSVRMKDNSVTKKRKLQFFAYDIANFHDFLRDNSIYRYFDMIETLSELWFDISSYFKKISNIDQVIKEIEEIGDVKSDLDFEIDGLVLKVNNIDLWEIIGWTQHHPRYAISYKFPAEILTTTIESVVHQVGRTGTITPVANLEPVHIGGVVVKRATLHNYDEVEKLGVWVGDRVFIKRAWEVIPKIISVASKKSLSSIHTEQPTFPTTDWEGRIYPPKECPSCGWVVKKDDSKVRYYCSNSANCPAQHSERLIFAVWKQWFDIDGLWAKQVELFLKEWIIHDLVDIFTIWDKKDEILHLEWFQEKSVENLVVGVEKAKNVDIVSFLTALGISWVGKKTAKTFSTIFRSQEDIFNFSFTTEQLEELNDIGPEIAKNLVEFMTHKENRSMLLELIDLLNISYYQDNTGVIENRYTQKRVCITGGFSGYSRDQLIKILESYGGEFVSGVSKKNRFFIGLRKGWK